MVRISIFDTSVGSLNLGDQIIMEAVNRELAELQGKMRNLNTCRKGIS